jgi:tetratricopeptide (TPR) repeat protein
MADEWYRASDWTDEAREEFERRLRRARPHNQSQYLRIKAITLREHGGEAERRGARELNERVLRNYPDASAMDLEVCLSELATLAEQEGAIEEAIEHLRAAVRLEDTTNVRGDGHLRLAELLARSDDPERWKEARKVVERTSDGDLAFSKERLRFAVLHARLAAKEGDDATAASFAKAALAEAARTKPDFSRHPDLGWASADPDTVAEMRALAEPG